MAPFGREPGNILISATRLYTSEYTLVTQVTGRVRQNGPTSLWAWQDSPVYSSILCTYRLICQNLSIEKKDSGPAGNAGGMSMSIQEDIQSMLDVIYNLLVITIDNIHERRNKKLKKFNGVHLRLRESPKVLTSAVDKFR